MKYLIISDTHNNRNLLKQVIETNSGVDGMFFLGDGMADLRAVIKNYPNVITYSVNGNCDGMGNELPKTIELQGHKIMFVHGDVYKVKLGLEKLHMAATARGCEIALFGHTHQPLKEKVGDVQLFNPGSLGETGLRSCTYGIMELNANEDPVFVHVST